MQNLDKGTYYRAVTLSESIRRKFLESIKRELSNRKITDLSSMQVMILQCIGERQLTIGELANQEFYLGTNVCPAVSKMIKNGYVQRVPFSEDRDGRLSYLELTKKGKKFLEGFSDFLDKQTSQVTEFVDPDDLNKFLFVIRRLDFFLSNSPRL